MDNNNKIQEGRKDKNVNGYLDNFNFSSILTEIKSEMVQRPYFWESKYAIVDVFVVAFRVQF